MSSESIGATGLAGRYAKALFELADEDGLLDTIDDDLSRLGAMIVESDDLNHLIRSPALSRDEQGRAMAAVIEKMGLSLLTGRFIAVIAENRRLFELPGMIAAFGKMLAARRGETTAEVIAATELTEQQVASIGESLKRAVGTNVAVSVNVDPGLIGGMVVKVGSRMVDSSLRTKLQQLRLAMIGVR